MKDLTETNKNVARRFIAEVFEAGRLESIDELVADDFRPHSWPGVGPGREPLKDAQQRVGTGLSDVSMKIEDMIAEGDRVAVRLTAQATQSGEFMGIPATGKTYTISETHIFRVTDGKLSEHWVDADMLGLLSQLGALPEAGASA